MDLSDYLPDWGDPNQQAIWGALGGLAKAATPIPGRQGMGALTGLLGTVGDVAGGMSEGAQNAQVYNILSGKASQEQANAAMMQNRIKGLQALQSIYQPQQFGGVPNMAPQVGQASSQIPQINASQLNDTLSGGSIPMPPSPQQIGGQQSSGQSAPLIDPAMALRAKMIGAQYGVEVPDLAPKMPEGWYLGQDSQMHPMQGGPADIGYQGNLAATKSAAAAAAETPYKIQQSVTDAAAHGAQARQTSAYDNYLNFGDLGLAGAGSLQNAGSPNGVNGGKPIPTQHGTVIPDVTDQSPIAKDATSLKATIPDWQKTSDAINSSVGPSQQASVRLNVMANALKQVQSGSFAENKANIIAGLNSVGVSMPDSAMNDAAAIQKVIHANVVSTLNSLKSTNPRFAQSEFKVLSQNSEHPDLQPGANLELLSDDLGTVNQNLALANDWRTAQKMGWRNPQDFQTSWMAKNSLQKFVNGARAKIGPLKGMDGNQ